MPARSMPHARGKLSLSRRLRRIVDVIKALSRFDDGERNRDISTTT
jgi:hypothetical protein